MQFSMRQLLVFIAIVALFCAVVAHGNDLLGDEGVKRFILCFAASLFVAIGLYFNWRKCSYFGRSIGIFIAVLPLLPILMPSKLMSDYDSVAQESYEFKFADFVNPVLRKQSRFHTVELRRRENLFEANGVVDCNSDLVDLKEFISMEFREYSIREMQLDWRVAVASSKNGAESQVRNTLPDDQ